MNEEEARAAAAALFTGYSFGRASKETLDLYQQPFMHMTHERALQIITRLHMVHQERPPNIGHVLAACMEQNEGARITGEEAYVQLTKAAQRYGRSYGPDDPPPKLDPIIMQALGVWGSWNQFCDSPDDDAAGRARFITLYEKLSQREQVAKVVPTPTSRQLVSAPERKQVPPRAALTVVQSMPEPRINKPPTDEELEEFERTGKVKP